MNIYFFNFWFVFIWQSFSHDFDPFSEASIIGVKLEAFCINLTLAVDRSLVLKNYLHGALSGRKCCLYCAVNLFSFNEFTDNERIVRQMKQTTCDSF